MEDAFSYASIGDLKRLRRLTKEENIDFTTLRDNEGRSALHLACASGHVAIVKFLITEQQCDPSFESAKGETPLFVAASSGHSDVVGYLLDEYKCDPLVGNKEGVTALHAASSNGHLDLVKRLISHGKCDPECVDGKGATALHHASRNGHVQIVRYFTSELKCDVSRKSNDGKTPLHSACEHGHIEVVKYITCECEWEPLQEDRNGATALLLACENGHFEVTVYLISEHECDPSCFNKNGRTPLHFACASSKVEIVKYLIVEQKCDPSSLDKNGWTPLHCACAKGNIEVVKYLTIEQKCDTSCLDKDGLTPVHIACINGMVEVVKYLIIEQKCDPLCLDNNGHTPLHCACYNGMVEVVKYLIVEQKCNPSCLDKNGLTPLHDACANGMLEVVKYLIVEQKCNPSCLDENGRTPLHHACAGGNVEVVKYLIVEQKCDPSCLDKSACAPLHYACARGKVEVVKYLIVEQKCDPLSLDKDWVTPLHYACTDGKFEVVKYLIVEQKCDPSCVNKNGGTPLHYACANGNVKIVKYLIVEQKCDPSCLDENGRTPLHCACAGGKVEVVKYLIVEQKYDPSCLDKNGSTPLHCACGNGKVDVVKYLIIEQKCDALCFDEKGWTPLHHACANGKVEVVKYLIVEQKCDPLYVNSDSQTHLHLAVNEAYNEIVFHLLLNHQRDPLPPNKEGITVLRLTLQFRNDSLVNLMTELIVSDKGTVGCEHLLDQVFTKETSLSIRKDVKSEEVAMNFVEILRDGEVVAEVNVQFPSWLEADSCDRNPILKVLHLAAVRGWLDVCRYLIDQCCCDPASVVYYGIVGGHVPVVDYFIRNQNVGISKSHPFHTACKFGQLEVLKYLIEHFKHEDGSINSDARAVLNSGDVLGTTPLHVACENGQLLVVKYLVEKYQCDLQAQDLNGFSVLHFACERGHVDVTTYLLSTGKVDPMARTNGGDTPIDVIPPNAQHKYDLLALFEHFEECRVDYPVESYCRIFFVGNSMAGKSSLAKVILERAKHFSAADLSGNVCGVEPLTAGIIPTVLHSREIGNAVLYDFAGHAEYYSSHGAILENLMTKSPAMFVIFVDLTLSKSEIYKQLYYWICFIENEGCRAPGSSQVIVVGSHADKIAPSVLKKKLDSIKKKCSETIRHQHFVDLVTLDCRKLESDSLSLFIERASDSHKAVIASSERISYYCHVLFAFMKKNLESTAAVSLEMLSKQVESENEPCLPSGITVLKNFLLNLGDKGLVLFLENEIDLMQSWVVVDIEALLHEVNGTIFAPAEFEEHNELFASNTGIVQVSSLKDAFPQYDVEMLVGFLTIFEFCFKIDSKTLGTIFCEVRLCNTSTQILFFPALVKNEIPRFVISLSFSKRSEWCLWAPDPFQFFTTRFLHTLILRLAYSVCSERKLLYMLHDESDARVFERRCHVWKNGIHFFTHGRNVVV